MCRTLRRNDVSWVIVCGMIAALPLAGCGEGDNLSRNAVSGTVKFNGEPLKNGLIEFQPAAPGISTTAAAGITDGSYSLSTSQGLQPAKYEVRITSAPQIVERKPGEMPGDNPMPAAKEIIPAKYNAKTTLTAEVVQGGTNRFEFDLQDK